MIHRKKIFENSIFKKLIFFIIVKNFFIQNFFLNFRSKISTLFEIKDKILYISTELSIIRSKYRGSSYVDTSDENNVCRKENREY